MKRVLMTAAAVVMLLLVGVILHAGWTINDMIDRCDDGTSPSFICDPERRAKECPGREPVPVGEDFACGKAR